MLAIGVDIGGTKCAVCLGKIAEEHVDILHKCEARKTQTYSVQVMLDCIVEDIIYCKRLLKANERIQGIGISCGGPLNRKLVPYCLPQIFLDGIIYTLLNI
jgi:glucokinase